MKLPLGFKGKISEDQELDGIVNTTLHHFGEILKEDKLYFFEEYTNHGINHIERVILSSDNLISQFTFEHILAPKDIAFYVLSVILHDIGMHLGLEGFNVLLEGGFDDVRVKEMDNHTWAELWHDYLNEAKRFSGKQLRDIFGDENILIRVPPIDNKGHINENDKKLIGEFIRRNHPRLAHEIALKGFPGKPEYIDFGKGLDFESKNIVGLIARSHGIDLRKCLTYIESVFGTKIRRTPVGIHAVYLMVVLRLADYIQIDSSRISKTLIKSRIFSSPLSDLEHKAHEAVKNVDNTYQDDPERIFVTAEPLDSNMFLKLKKLLFDIQHEFDISWAVLGELYGGIENKPQIKYRRVNSNLEEPQFINKQQYVADIFTFKANDEIIRLLIGPLYGDEPSYGVRELLQNSIDACKEKAESGDKSYIPSIKISIESRQNNYFFRIADNGIGMNSELIKEYFLSAGASYRKSIDWQKKYVGSSGDVKIRKSGRFGIGLLAAFLIGKEISVRTKRVGELCGYSFDADLFSEQINILKNDLVEEGTTIQIKITREILEKLYPYSYNNNIRRWYDWYTLKLPKIEYSYLNDTVTNKTNKNPDIDEKLPIEWNSIEVPGFTKILWTYSEKYFDCRFSCNGFVIPQNLYTSAHIYPILRYPQISIFDNNAITPLALNRNSFSNPLPFHSELKEDICKEYIAYLLMFGKIQNSAHDLFPFLCKLNFSGTRKDYESYSYGPYIYDNKYYRPGKNIDNILISKKGFIVDYNFFINKIGKINVLLIQTENLEIMRSQIDLDIQDRFVYFTNAKLNAIEDYKAAIGIDHYPEYTGEGYHNDLDEEMSFPDIENENTRIYMSEEKYEFLFASSKKRLPTWLSSICELKYVRYGWACVEIGKPKKSLINDSFLKKYSGKINFIREYEIYSTENGDSILDKLFTKYLGKKVIIPFDLSERKKKYPLAFKELKRYMEKYKK